MTKRANPEHAIQRTVIDLLRMVGIPNLVVFHVPNGGKRNLIEAARLKAAGTMAGIPDLVLVADGRASFLELKAQRGKLSAAQDLAQAALRKAGARVETAYGIDQAIDVLKQWGLVREVVS
jgi:hypothetical protein